MFKEERIIDGVLCLKSMPDGKFYKYTQEALTRKLVEAQTSFNSDYTKLQKVKDPELSKCIKNIQVAVEKLGNFA